MFLIEHYCFDKTKQNTTTLTDATVGIPVYRVFQMPETNVPIQSHRKNPILLTKQLHLEIHFVLDKINLSKLSSNSHGSLSIVRIVSKQEIYLLCRR
jgi:hypothetical protein